MELGLGDADLVGVVAFVELGVDLKTGGRGRRGDEVDDDLHRDEPPGAPVAADEAKQVVLDLVPLARAGRQMTDRDLQAAVVGEAL